MNPRIRTTLFIIFCALFFAGGFALLFYASGYRYHSAKGKIEKIGQLEVESIPAGAHVLLDGSPPVRILDRLFGRTVALTPFRANKLLPGSYVVTLKKDGYFDLSKRVTVVEGKTTQLTNAVLLRQSRQETLLSDIASVDQVLPLAQGTMLVSGKKLVVSMGNDIKTIPLPDRPLAFSRSPSEARYLIELPSQWLILEGQGNIVSLPFDKKPVAVRWSLNDDLLYAMTKDGVVSLTRQGKVRRAVYRGKVRDMILADSGIILLTQEKNSVLSIPYGGTIPRTLRIPSSFRDSIVRIERAIRDSVIVETASNRLATIPLKDSSEDIQIFAASNSIVIDDNHVLFWGEFEISLFRMRDNAEKRTTLVTRQSSPIASVLWNADIPYIFIVFKDGRMHATKLYSENERAEYEIVSSQTPVRSAYMTRQGVGALVDVPNKQKQEVRFYRLAD